MKLSSREILRRLGSGERLADVCAAAGLSDDAWREWWRAESRARVPRPSGTYRTGVRQSVRLERDRRGVPHLFAGNDEDLFFGFGYAMAQDRLFQLDFLRRKGSGRLAEVLGAESGQLDFLVRMVGVPSVLDWDLLARTVGIRRIAEAEWHTLPAETQALLTAFSHGINAHLDETRAHLPIEFDLLDYQPEPWSPVDSLTIEVDFRWYLTGRFPVIVIPEMARRILGDGPLFRALLQGEWDEESIIWPGEYSPTRAPGVPPERVGMAVSEPQSNEGSNNWVVSGQRSVNGKPLLASDPHVPFDAVSWWYEAVLRGGSFDVAGMAYAGMPAVMFGRNARVAWGCTNNICSQRDLYQEKTDPAHPDCFLHDGRWEPARQREEVIQVKGGSPVRKTIRFSRNGPLVEEVLPPAARQTGPVSLKWLGASQGGWLTALLGMDRAQSATACQATRPWHVPTFSVVFADVEGHIGYQSVGRIPIRNVWERGYRPGWEAKHQWQGLIPFEGMPGVLNPPRGWVATANNRPAPDDFPYPLSGTWTDGFRAARIHQLIEAQPRLAAPADFGRMQQDALSLRGQRALPGLLAVLDTATTPRLQEAAKHLRAWDGRMDTDRIGATLFDVFFTRWVKRVVRERLDGPAVGLLSGGGSGLAAALLHGDAVGWFGQGKRGPAILEAMNAALDYCSERLGPDTDRWQWGRLHTLAFHHVLAGRGDLGRLLDQVGGSVRGDHTTVCNTGLGGQLEARMGANYRMIADLGSSPPTLLAVDGHSQSGHPGSPHYADQLSDWLEERYHTFVLGAAAGSDSGHVVLELEPQK